MHNGRRCNDGICMHGEDEQCLAFKVGFQLCTHYGNIIANSGEKD
jgi:hypothetical protein